LLSTLNVTRFPSTVKAQSTPTIFIDPAATNATSNSNFSVNINVTYVTDLCSWQVFIYYLKDVLQGAGYSEGPLLKSHGSTMFDGGYNNNYNATHGQLWMWCLRTWSGHGVDDAGTLGIATFKAQWGGSSPLSLDDTILGNSSAQGMSHTTQDGSVQVGSHDVGITSILSYKTAVGQGYGTTVNVTVKNKGTSPEEFNTTLYANTTSVQTDADTTLPDGQSTNVTLVWDTTGFTMGNYSISVNIPPVPYESNTTDNTMIDGIVLVTFPGDVDANFKVDMTDIMLILAAFGSGLGKPKYNPNCDIDNSLQIDMTDIMIALGNFGRHYP
jgi:hypothetical protein